MIRGMVVTIVTGMTWFVTGCVPMGPATTAREFTAELTGEAERPNPVNTPAQGTGSFTLNEAETELAFSIEASGFPTDLIGAHFHISLTGPEGFGGIIFDITDTIVVTGEGSVMLEGVWPVTPQDVVNLRLGYIYVNLHTDEHPAGEIRGNLVPVE